MIRIKAFALLCFSAASATSFASFDLMYIPLANGRVQRYDPVHNIGLGTASIPASARSVYYNGGREGLVNLTAGSYRYDMVNGTNLGFTSFNPLAMSEDGSEAYRIQSSFISTINTATGSVTSGATLSLSGGTAISATRIGLMDYVGSISGNILTMRSYISSTGATVSTVTRDLGAPITDFTAPITTTDRLGNTYMVQAAIVAGVQRIISTRFVPSGTLFTPTLATAVGFSLTEAALLARAHSGYYVVGRDATTSTLTRISSYDNDGSGIAYASVTESFETNATAHSMGMLLAPEPSSMAALLAGGLLLLRRSGKNGGPNA